MKTILVKILALTCAALIVPALAACGVKTDTDTKNDIATPLSAVATADSAASTKDEQSLSTADSAAPSIDPAVALVGSWEYEGGIFTYTFNDDGTGCYDMGSAKAEFTYTVSESVLSITYAGSDAPSELEYKLRGDTLDVIDSLGSDTIYIKH